MPENTLTRWTAGLGAGVIGTWTGVWTWVRNTQNRIKRLENNEKIMLRRLADRDDEIEKLSRIVGWLCSRQVDEDAPQWLRDYVDQHKPKH